MKASRGQILLGAGIAVAVIAVIAGAIVAGSPTEGRMQRLDQERARDLRTIAMAIDGFWGRHARLPESLDELVGDPRTQVSVEDPATAQPYEYRVVDGASYELCAVFDLASLQRSRAREAFWMHDAGRYCFSLTASMNRRGF